MILVLLLACRTCPGDTGLPDRDGDGIPDGEDCAPDDGGVGQTLPEICGDGVDNDCDGEVDTDCQYFGGVVSADPYGVIRGSYTMGRWSYTPWAGRATTALGDIDGNGQSDVLVAGDDRPHDLQVFTELRGTQLLSDSVYAVDDAGAGRVTVFPTGDLDRPGLGIASTASACVFLVSNPTGSHDDEDGYGSSGSACPESWLSVRDWEFGHRVAVSDHDHDGAPELVVTAPGASFDGGVTGAIVFITPPSDHESWSPSTSTVLAGWERSYFGRAVLAFDADGDGIRDLLVGTDLLAFDPSGATAYAGMTWLFDGPVSVSSAADADQIIPGEVAWDGMDRDYHHRFVGFAGIGDVDGDGVPDATMQYQASDTENGRDETRVYANGPASAQTATISIPASSPFFEYGASASVAGDLDADGFDDVLVGTPGHDDGRGIAYVFFGPLSGTLTPDDAFGWIEGDHGAFEHCPDETPECQHLGAGMGTAVAGVGDVNGDGFDDVMVGAPWTDTVLDDDQHGEGAAYLFLGGN